MGHTQLSSSNDVNTVTYCRNCGNNVITGTELAEFQKRDFQNFVFFTSPEEAFS
jgi:hypothetical protein